MKALKREIVIGIVTALATLSAVWLFFENMEKEKISVQTDLYTLIAPYPNVILSINRPLLFSKTFLNDSSIQKAFASKIPEVYSSIIRHIPSKSPLLLSFHPQGILCYAKVDNGWIKKMQTDVFQNLFGSFSPQIQKKGDLTFFYYPDTRNRFFGYFSYKGIWVASYSKKLLEEVAKLQQSSANTTPPAWKLIQKSFDRLAPANVMFRAELLNLYVITDTIASTGWRVPDGWMGGDLFTSEGHVCYFGNLPYDTAADSLYVALADTLSSRIEHLFPSLRLTHQLTNEKGKIYYTGCQESKKSKN